MIRTVEISVLLGIKSRGLGIGHKKKGAPTARPSNPALGITSRAGGL
jgi:hypothetical protein